MRIFDRVNRAGASADLLLVDGNPLECFCSVTDRKNLRIIMKDFKICRITLKALCTSGLVVAPGFVDVHQHCVDPYIHRLMVRDGRYHYGS